MKGLSYKINNILIYFQVQQNIMLQAKPHPQATSQFSSQQDVPVDKVVIPSSAGADTPAQISSVLQPASMVIKTPASGQMPCPAVDIKQDTI